MQCGIQTLFEISFVFDRLFSNFVTFDLFPYLLIGIQFRRAVGQKEDSEADSDALEPIPVPSESHETAPGLRLKSRDARVRGSGRLKTRYTVPNSPSLPSPNS